MAGGGNRSTIYGSREYGSGYPGISGRGVGGRGFPYWFWPIVWVSAVALITPAAYLYAAAEYGLPGNLDRPGGSMIDAAFMSSSTGAMYRVLADNSTVVALSAAIKINCSSSIGGSSSLPVGSSSDSSQAQAEQAVQYYRASSVVLTMDGYNNSAIFGPEGAPDSALPTNVDIALLNCINNTIGASVPLVDAAWLPMAEHTIVSFLLLRIVSFLFDAFM